MAKEPVAVFATTHVAVLSDAGLYEKAFGILWHCHPTCQRTRRRGVVAVDDGRGCPNAAARSDCSDGESQTSSADDPEEAPRRSASDVTLCSRNGLPIATNKRDVFA